jgi:hypothetical protein
MKRCCNGDCEQGDNCPARDVVQELTVALAYVAVILVCCLAGLAMAGFFWGTWK